MTDKIEYRKGSDYWDLKKVDQKLDTGNLHKKTLDEKSHAIWFKDLAHGAQVQISHPPAPKDGRRKGGSREGSLGRGMP